ncbi:MAG: hypothetical protein IAF08_12370 [Rhizobacter sp.]|nr:hypothetical protein [Chlorobiales bacterium]
MMNLNALVPLYWFAGLFTAFFFLRDELKTFNRDFGWKRIGLFILSAVVVAANSYIYYRAASSEQRPLDPLTLVFFTVANGLCETFIYLGIFKFGEFLAGKYTQNKFLLYSAGLCLFFVYAGGIHAIFWLNVLPEHLSGTTVTLAPMLVLPRSAIFIPFQVLLVVTWSLIYFLYRDLWSVAVLHAVVDFVMVLSIHYSMFVPVEAAMALH